DDCVCPPDWWRAPSSVHDAFGWHPAPTSDHSVGINPTWSPDGRRIAFDDGDRIMMVDADGSNLRPLTRRRDGFDSDPAWSPDGRVIAFTALTTSVRPTRRGGGAS